jgi:hypothetical protein
MHFISRLIFYGIFIVALMVAFLFGRYSSPITPHIIAVPDAKHFSNGLVEQKINNNVAKNILHLTEKQNNMSTISSDSSIGSNNSDSSIGVSELTSPLQNSGRILDTSAPRARLKPRQPASLAIDPSAITSASKSTVPRVAPSSTSSATGNSGTGTGSSSSKSISENESESESTSDNMPNDAWCRAMRKKYQVQPRKSWGMLKNLDLQIEWKEKRSCDVYFAEKRIGLRPLSSCPSGTGKPGAGPLVAVLAGSTSRRIVDPSFHKIALFVYLLPSLIRTTECGFDYVFVLGYDVGDAFYDKPGVRPLMMMMMMMCYRCVF